MRTNNYSAKANSSSRYPAMFILGGALLGVVADLTFGLPLLGTSLGASFGLWAGAAAESIAEAVSGDIAAA